MSAPDGFGPIVCKNHTHRLAVDPIGCRWCAECKADAEARYADPSVNVKLGTTYERERVGTTRTAGGGQEQVFAFQEKWK